MGYAFCCGASASLHIISNSHNAVKKPLLQSHNKRLMAQALWREKWFSMKLIL